MANHQRARKLLLEGLRAEALRLYSLGHPYRKVAEVLSRPEVTTVTDDGVTTEPALVVSHMWVKRAVDRELRALAERAASSVEAWRGRELAALDVMEQALATKIAAGDDDAIRTRLLIQARRAKYLPGVEAPVQVEATFTRQLPPGVAGRMELARLRMAERERRMLQPAATATDEPVDAELIE